LILKHSFALTETAASLGGDIDDALDQLRVPAHLVDSDGLVRWQNAKSVALFGDIRGRAFTEMFAPEARSTARPEFTKKVLGTARATDFEAVIRGLSGGRVPVEIHSVAVESGERVVGVFGIVDLEGARSRPPPLRNGLTPRQLEVLHALARGCSTEQIAEASNLSRETVRNHVRAILRALHVHSRLAAVAEARRRGLVD
jgi:DNA-binding CsgD family transcriptional regulator